MFAKKPYDGKLSFKVQRASYTLTPTKFRNWYRITWGRGKNMAKVFNWSKKNSL